MLNKQSLDKLALVTHRGYTWPIPAAAWGSSLLNRKVIFNPVFWTQRSCPESHSCTLHFVLIEHILLNPNEDSESHNYLQFLSLKGKKKKKGQGVTTAHIYWEPSVTPLIKTHL